LGELEYYSLLVHLSDSDKDLEHVVSLGCILWVAQMNDKTVDSIHNFRLVRENETESLVMSGNVGECCC
jgi:hypothetical protein